MTDQTQPPVKFYVTEVAYVHNRGLLFDVLRAWLGPRFDHVEFDTHAAALAAAKKVAVKYPGDRFAVIQMHETVVNEGGQINVHDVNGELA